MERVDEAERTIEFNMFKWKLPPPVRGVEGFLIIGLGFVVISVLVFIVELITT